MSDTNVIDELAGEEEAIPQEADAVDEPVDPPVDDPEEKEPPKQDTVPHAAFHEERERRKELQQQLRETQDKMTRMEALWERIQQERTEQEKPAVPDPETDPDGYYRAKIQSLEEELEGIKGQGKERQERDSQQQQQQVMLERYAADVRRFSGEHADFNEAYAYLAKTMDEDLQARGFEDPQERSAALQYEEGMLVGRAFRTGKSPAEAIYNYARKRGFKPANGHDKLETLQKGATAAKSLSGTRARPEGTVTLERLAELDGEEFDKAWNDARRKGIL